MAHSREEGCPSHTLPFMAFIQTTSLCERKPGCGECQTVQMWGEVQPSNSSSKLSHCGDGLELKQESECYSLFTLDCPQPRPKPLAEPLCREEKTCGPWMGTASPVFAESVS